MATQFMEYSEIKLSRIEQTEDSLTDTNIFIRKIFLLGFIEYFITFSVCTGIFVSFAYIPFLLCYILSFIFQFYFELQSAIENQRIRQKLNIVIGSISIITNCFSNYAIWSNICSGLKQIIFYRQLINFGFFSNFIKFIHNDVLCQYLSHYFPKYFCIGNFYINTIFSLIYGFLFLGIQKLKSFYNIIGHLDIINDGINGLRNEADLQHTRRNFSQFMQIARGPSLNRPICIKNGYRCISLCKQTVSTQYSRTSGLFKEGRIDFLYNISCKNEINNNYFSDYVSGQYQLSSWLTQYTTEDKETLQFTLFFWISLGISLILYPIVLLQHQSLSLQLRCIISFIQLLFYCFTFYGILLYLLFLSYQTATGFFLFSQFYCSLLGLSMGLLTYTFNIQQQKIYLKFHAFISMIICPFCVWILNIFYNSSLLSFYLLIFFLLFALWISFELEWQIQKGTFQLKQCDFFIGVIQIMELPFSILSRILALLF